MRTQIVVSILLLFSINSFSQWEKIIDLNTGTTGQVMTYNSFVYWYGSQQGFKLYRFDANGENFTDLSANTPPDLLSHIYGFDNKLYACSLSDFYVSTDDGESWNLKSSLNVTGNGAILRIVQDGDILYGVSNRKSIFKSTDKGDTWQEIIINDPNNIALNGFAAEGNNYFAVIIGSGAWISTDAGTTWTVNNPNQSSAINALYDFNGTIMGMTFNGIFIYNFSSGSWEPSNSGLPDDGALYNVKSISQFGNTLFAAGSKIINNQSSVYISSDDGTSWNEMNPDSIAQANYAGSISFIAASSSFAYYFYYGLLDPGNTGLYKAPYSPASAVKKMTTNPQIFLYIRIIPTRSILPHKLVMLSRSGVSFP